MRPCRIRYSATTSLTHLKSARSDLALDRLNSFTYRPMDSIGSIGSIHWTSSITALIRYRISFVRVRRLTTFTLRISIIVFGVVANWRMSGRKSGEKRWQIWESGFWAFWERALAFVF
jgi:hypothetical protein